MGAIDNFKSLDIFRKLPQDLSQSTRSGALISVICGCLITLLFLSELVGYLHVKIISNMIIDQNRGSEKINVNLDITFYRLPCLILSLDKQDVMGTHHVNVGEHLNKYSIDKDGNQISVFKKVEKYQEHQGHVHDQSNDVDLQSVKTALENKEGCRIQGYLDINRVPGNFHISTHAFQHVVQFLFTDDFQLDLSHRIDQFSIGDFEEYKHVINSFSSFKGSLTPLNGIDEKQKIDSSQSPYTYQYYLNIVPSIYEDLFYGQYHLNQFTANTLKARMPFLPAIYFKYDFNGVTVRVRKTKTNFFHFIVQICAIVGGVFTLAMMLDSLIYKISGKSSNEI